MSRKLDFSAQMKTPEDLKHFVQVQKMLKSEYNIVDFDTALLVYDIIYRIEGGASIKSLWEAHFYGNMQNV